MLIETGNLMFFTERMFSWCRGGVCVVGTDLQLVVVPEGVFGKIDDRGIQFVQIQLERVGQLLELVQRLDVLRGKKTPAYDDLIKISSKTTNAYCIVLYSSIYIQWRRQEFVMGVSKKFGKLLTLFRLTFWGKNFFFF